ncbi:SGNH/GDSL hydrolase family protein [Sorangium sp. So ce1036]|uniref:SGNH/GDSL hydrolase family protein n=1 Tax=Sorangium sp. So ce1036 TaxID=3133328 RepID=UPI003F03C2E4
MTTQAYYNLPRLAGALCIAWSALAGCGDESGDTTAGAGGGTTSATSGAGGEGGDSTTASTSGTGGSNEGGGNEGGGNEGGSNEGGGNEGGSGSGDATIRFIGRFDTTDPAGPRFGWPGSAIVTRFSGTGIRARFNDESPLNDGPNYFEVVIDGESQGALEVSGPDKVYTVAENLPDGEHDLLLHRRTEGLIGWSQFLEFIPEEGEQLLPVAPAPDRRIEVIGDSISAGYGVDGPDETCPFTSATENNYLTYGPIAARQLGADATIIAWSGRGAYRNYADEAAPTMPELYGRTLPDEAQPAWDFSSWVPQVVVINLGTNDFSVDKDGKGVNPGEPFREAYAGLVETVRTNYPDALIFCTVGPMLSDGYPEGTMALSTVRSYITQVVEDRTEDGDDKVRYLEFPEHDGTNGRGCDWHPSAKTQQLMAQQLAEAISAELGW